MSRHWSEVFTFKLAVRRLFERRSGPKVYNLDVQRPRVNNDVLVFDVPVYHAMSVNEAQRLHDLTKKPEKKAETV